jgi:hypothetical protein
MAVYLVKVLLDDLDAGDLLACEEPLQVHGIGGEDIKRLEGHAVEFWDAESVMFVVGKRYHKYTQIA